ncbi:hypothetical protein GCM10020358_49280 [Amorphoplanes nipponensis]|uniref:Uncharacterized protein n=2 Tax=Actinoplanes nipponensis TaxID=135950 RepID=A0A919JPM4_9ACTN|nr:hypothetical protein Ani05nite_66810 [Actinoplanes nipponensis]
MPFSRKAATRPEVGLCHYPFGTADGLTYRPVDAPARSRLPRMIKMRFAASGAAAAVVRGGAALVVGGVLTLAAAGCAGQVSGTGPADAQSFASAEPTPDPRPSSAPRIHPRWRSCAGEPSMRPQDEGLDAVSLLHFAGTFHPVAAVRCREDTQRRPDGGTDAIAVEDRADDVAALLAALRLPDAPPPSPEPSAGDEPPDPDPDLICTLEGYSPPRLVLLDGQGRWVRPGIPRDACGKPLAEAAAAMDKLHWTRVTTRVLGEVESAEAAASGCDQVFTDMVWFTGVYPPTRQGDLAPLADDAASVRLCVYQVKASGRDSEKPQGDFVAGGLLPTGRWAAVKRAVQTSGKATTCTTPANRFARLETPRGDIYVELDGCRRLVAQGVLPGDGTSGDTIRQASTDLPALLTKP